MLTRRQIPVSKGIHYNFSTTGTIARDTEKEVNDPRNKIKGQIRRGTGLIN